MREYEIGDRVLMHGFEFMVTFVRNENKDRDETYELTKVGPIGTTQDASAGQIKPDLYNINKPFGLCGKAVQEALEEARNGKFGEESNIEIFTSNKIWEKSNPYFLSGCYETYRLVGKPKVKTVTMKEVCDKFGCEVIITDGDIKVTIGGDEIYHV